MKKPRWQSGAELKARAENEQPWEPLPGMRKIRCDRCEYWFASHGRVAICPDCLELEKTGREYGSKRKDA